MSVVERIRERQISIREASANLTLDQIPYLKFSELRRRNIAIQIFSEVLDCEVWLCSNEGMATQVN